MVLWWRLCHRQEVVMERMPQRTEALEMRLRRGVLAVAAAAALAVSACAAPGGGSTNAPATQGVETIASGSPAAGGVTLALANDATLGSFVTGANGMSLYIFTPDTGTTSACVDQCAANWPPLTVASAADAQAGTGVTGTLGTITRPDGTLQVTLGGHPLYYFANDKAAGDLNGQGLNDKWYAAGPDGAGLGMTAGPAPADSSAPEKTPCPQSDRTCY
jgi:predicted lipoprotein with Yx(FWY)xxD motif